MKAPFTMPVGGAVTRISLSVENDGDADVDVYKNGVFWFLFSFTSGVNTEVLIVDHPFLAGDTFYAEHSGGDELKEVVVGFYVEQGFITDAPIDGVAYGRKDGAWVPVLEPNDPGTKDIQLGDILDVQFPTGNNKVRNIFFRMQLTYIDAVNDYFEFTTTTAENPSMHIGTVVGTRNLIWIYKRP